MRPSGAMAGPPTMCVPSALHNSVAVSFASFQTLSPAPAAETYRRYPGPSRGENMGPVFDEICTGVDGSTAEPLFGWGTVQRQSVLLVLARVVTIRRPSALAASDV